MLGIVVAVIAVAIVMLAAAVWFRWSDRAQVEDDFDEMTEENYPPASGESDLAPVWRSGRSRRHRHVIGGSAQGTRSKVRPLQGTNGPACWRRSTRPARGRPVAHKTYIGAAYQNCQPDSVDVQYKILCEIQWLEYLGQT